MTQTAHHGLRRDRLRFFERRPDARPSGESRWVLCGRWPIHYRMAGHGRPVLLLHGLGSSARYWDGLAADLSRRYRLIMPDLIGFGDSAKPYVAYGPDLHHAALSAVLDDALAGEPVDTVVGHSLGSVLAIRLANRLPRPPAAAVLITPPFPLGAGQFRRETCRQSPVNRLLLSCEPVTRLTHVGMQAVWPAVCRLRTRRALFTPELLAEYGKYTYHSYTSTLKHCLFDFDLRPDLLRAGDLPTLVLHGRHDRLVPPDHAPAIASLLTNTRLECLPSRHHPVLSHRAAVGTRIVDWLERQPRG